MILDFVLQSSDVLYRIRAEYSEMPGLKLTAAQAQRLLGVERESCDRCLASLVTAGFLARTRDGAFVRRDGSFVR
jgi:DNA-binding IclR family transcriptional regulator